MKGSISAWEIPDFDTDYRQECCKLTSTLILAFPPLMTFIESNEYTLK